MLFLVHRPLFMRAVPRDDLNVNRASLLKLSGRGSELVIGRKVVGSTPGKEISDIFPSIPES